MMVYGELAGCGQASSGSVRIVSGGRLMPGLAPGDSCIMAIAGELTVDSGGVLAVDAIPPL